MDEKEVEEEEEEKIFENSMKEEEEEEEVRADSWAPNTPAKSKPKPNPKPKLITYFRKRFHNKNNNSIDHNCTPITEKEKEREKEDDRVLGLPDLKKIPEWDHGGDVEYFSDCKQCCSSQFNNVSAADSELNYNNATSTSSSHSPAVVVPPSTPFSSPGYEKSPQNEAEEIKDKEKENHIGIPNLPSTPPSNTNSKKRKQYHFDLNKTRKKMYRPKVIGQAKPKPTPKRATSKRASIEPLTPRRVSSKKTASKASVTIATSEEQAMNAPCRRRLIFDVEKNSEEKYGIIGLLEEAKTSPSILESRDGTQIQVDHKENVCQTGCEDNFIQVTSQRIDRSSDCHDAIMKININFPIFCKRKRTMRRRIKLDNRKKIFKLRKGRNKGKTMHLPNGITNNRALIDELPSVVKTKKKRSKRCTPRKDLARLTEIAFFKRYPGEMPLLQTQESKNCWGPHEMKKDALSVGGNEGMIIEEKSNLELNNNKSEESMLVLEHENIAETSIGTFPTVANLRLKSSQSEGRPPQLLYFSFTPELREIAEGMMRSSVEMEPNFIDLNLHHGKSERSLGEHEGSLMTIQSRDLAEEGVIVISQIPGCSNSSYAQNFAQNGHGMTVPYQGKDQNADVPHIVPCGKLLDEVQNENLNAPHTDNGVLVPVHQGQLSVIKKTKKHAALEIYSDDIKAWRLQLKSITSVDEETKERLESERILFHSRILAFTACMHAIQGDRRFSPWKGSVVDSVVGVFLTQNVSDNLSSSAFMSLAAKFPAQSNKHEDHVTVEIQESTASNTGCTLPANHLVGPELLSREGATKDTNDIEDAALETQETTLFGPLPLSNSCLVSDCNLGDNKPKSSVDETSGKEKRSKSKEQQPSEREKTDGKKKKKEEKKKENEIDWDELRRTWNRNGERNNDHKDSVNWEAVRHAHASEIADAIKARGQHNIIADRLKEFLDRVVQLHGNIDLEWLRHAPPDKVKEYLLDFNGLGLKSVECIRLLGLQHVAFPVDTNVGRIAIRLGWVPLEPLPEELHIHLLQQYPIMDSIQKYLWPRLSSLDQKTLYELHYQLITFGKVYCTKRNPNCNSCPMKGDCRHFASAYASARRALAGPANKDKSSSQAPSAAVNSPGLAIKEVTTSIIEPELSSGSEYQAKQCEPIIEEPVSPKPVNAELLERDIEDFVVEDDPDEIPTIRLDGGEFASNLERLCREMKYMELQDNEVSRALVTLSPQVSIWPTPKLKHVSRLRTKHLVYELPDSHPLLKELDRRVPDDPSPYLLAIWTPGETASSFEPSDKLCSSHEFGSPCNEETCSACNILREQNANTVRGTILIPCRTAMRGSFPLNGTYFQHNEVFADHKSSEHPIDVPREWLWNLQRRIAYFGTSTTAIFRGLLTDEIRYCFWKGFVCVRAFDRETRTPKRLAHRLHISTTSQAGKPKTKKTMDDE